MNYRNKIFINKDPEKKELGLIRSIVKNIDIKQILKDSFVYIYVFDDGNVEVLTYQDNHVYLISKDLNVNNKMAVEYLMEKEEIEQNVNSVLYWAGINDIKKYVPVLSEEINKGVLKKKYANLNIYAKNITEALYKLPSISSAFYLYLEDVDE